MGALRQDNGFSKIGDIRIGDFRVRNGRISVEVGKTAAGILVFEEVAVLAAILLLGIVYGKEYVDVGIEYYEKQYRQRVVKNLERRAAQLQLCLIPIAKLRTELAG